MISLVEINICQKQIVVMVRATKGVTRAKDYGSSQPDLGKEPPPTETPLHIQNTTDKPEGVPRIPKGVLKRSGHNPNA